MKKSIERFEDLWTSDKDDYVLVNIDGPDAPLSSYTIFYANSNNMLVIECEKEECEEVIRNMRDSGVPVLDRIPKNNR